MKTHRPLRTLIACVTGMLVVAITPIASAQQPENLLPEGQMIGEEGSAPRGWESPHPNWLSTKGAEIALGEDFEDQGNLVTITSTEPGFLARMQTKLEINPAWVGRKLVFKAKMRGTQITPGPESWHLAGLLLDYTRKDGSLDHGPGRLALEVPSPQWRTFTGSWTVPADATTLNISVGLLGATGEIQLRDIEFYLE